MTLARKRLCLLSLAGLAAVTACNAEQPQRAVLTAEGLGPVRIGMTPAEAAAGLGAALEAKGAESEDACWQTRRADGKDPEVFYMVENGRITRIDVDSSVTGAAGTAGQVKTDRGFGTGAPEAEVLKAYGSQAVVQPHKYDEAGHYLVIDSADKKSAVLYETSNGTVTTFRAGIHPSVDYVEGCS